MRYTKGTATLACNDMGTWIPVTVPAYLFNYAGMKLAVHRAVFIDTIENKWSQYATRWSVTEVDTGFKVSYKTGYSSRAAATNAAIERLNEKSDADIELAIRHAKEKVAGMNKANAIVL